MDIELHTPAFGESRAESGFRDATIDDAESIREIYREALIPASRFKALVAEGALSAQAREAIRRTGGFINPYDPGEMRLSLEHGLALLWVEAGVVAGYNRIVTDPEQVLRLFCDEFLVGDPAAALEQGALSDWEGNRALDEHTRLRRVRWVDKALALRALRAAMAGAAGAGRGKLAWSLDTATRSDFNRRGISQRLVLEIRQRLRPDYALRAFRFFEIRQVNGIPVGQQNSVSRSLFTGSDTRPFASTDVEIRHSPGLLLGIRWHQWIRSINPRDFG